jgi:chromosome segregation ATPase
MSTEDFDHTIYVKHELHEARRKVFEANRQLGAVAALAEVNETKFSEQHAEWVAAGTEERDRWQKVSAEIASHMESVDSNISPTYVAVVVSEMWKRREELGSTPSLLKARQQDDKRWARHLQAEQAAVAERDAEIERLRRCVDTLLGAVEGAGCSCLHPLIAGCDHDASPVAGHEQEAAS